jgi:hypothetical protein
MFSPVMIQGLIFSASFFQELSGASAGVREISRIAATMKLYGDRDESMVP